MRILVVKPSSFGDILHTFPAVACLESSLEEPVIDWVVNENLSDVVGMMPGIRRRILFPRKNPWSFSALKGFLADLRREQYDVVLDFQGLFRSAVISRIAKAGERIGFADAREGAAWSYSRRITVPREEHAVRKNLMLAQQAFSLSGSWEAGRIRLQIPQETRERASRILPDGRPAIAVCFASRWSSKNWPERFFAETLRVFSGKLPECRILLMGGAEDRAEAERLSESLPMASVLAGETSVPLLAALLEKCRAMFTVDSGPMHLAALLDVPCVALFGSTNPVLTGPYGKEGRHSIIASTCSHSPCFRRQCPLGRDCSDGVSPESAAEELFRFYHARCPK